MRHNHTVAAPGVQPWLWMLLLTALLGPGRCNFVSSLQSNFVVNLNFEGEADSGSAADGKISGDSRLMAFAGGRQKFRCSLPSNNRRIPETGSPEANDLSKYKTHFRDAKLAPLKGKCWTTVKDYWSYDICFGRKILQYRPDAEMKFSLGEYEAREAELHADGHVTESYVGGTDNRSTTLHYVCGQAGEKRAFTIDEPKPLRYDIVITSPVFCAWRDKDGLETTDRDGFIHPVSSLLEDLRGNCINVTQGWWTYEYCYPSTLLQFHQSSEGRVTPHVLGTLNKTNAPTDPGTVKMDAVRLKPSITPRERRAPPSNQRTLRQYLGRGTVCDETNRPRTTTMHFQCPPNWQSQPETRIVNINEGSLCEYEIMVHTNLLCGHQKFIPALPRGKEEIKCVAQVPSQR
jgi:hypothetical protein